MGSGGEMASVAPEDEWITKLDLKAFGEEVRELGNKLQKAQGADDVKHLNKILRWNWMFTILGVGSMWMTPNVFTVTCLSTALFSRWTMIGHHVCHGGYDNTEASKSGYSRWVFAVGSLVRRTIDWFDWMLPEAWNIEHGRLHHYSLNEDNDPDLVEKNVKFLRTLNAPKAVKYLIALFFALTWKWSYYSPNTYSQLLLNNKIRELNTLEEQLKELGDKTKSSGLDKIMDEKKDRHVVTMFSLLDGSTPSWWSTPSFLMRVLLPFIAYRFLILPLPLLALMGTGAFYNGVINLVLADLLTNMHSFLAVVPNHAGEDLYYFEDHCKPMSDEFFLRQVVGSVDFQAGNDYVDFFHGFLNYQVEHHLWPTLSMLSYQKSHPMVKEICARHGVPFVQHNVFYRLKKTLQIFTGENSMRVFRPELLKERS
mmetsp:Transcript_4771/g.8480  ORF Transcript_4771/g.8480 Transcript_4771/m.8480 type:complete len:425 (-) Transcript_4771:92-1366(-)